MNKTRVLLVEDEEDAREILGFYLNTVFDEVVVAQDGEEGFTKFLDNFNKGCYFDVIVTDIKMPNKDGLTMLEEIASMYEDQKFIIVTAHKEEEYLFRSINLNVISYFVKPLVVENIMQILKKLKNKVIEKKESSMVNDTHMVKINTKYAYDKEKKLLYCDNELVSLSKKESMLVDALLSKKGEINTIEYLKEAIWNDASTSDATLRTVIKRVKDKIAQEDFILSKKGLGYIVE